MMPRKYGRTYLALWIDARPAASQCRSAMGVHPHSFFRLWLSSLHIRIQHGLDILGVLSKEILRYCSQYRLKKLIHENGVNVMEHTKISSS